MKPVAAALLSAAILALSFSSVLADSGRRIPAPDIVSKDQWGSMKEGDRYQDRVFDPYSQGLLGDPVAITIHHTYRPAGANPPDSEQDKKKLLEIQNFHVGKGWGDIGYHLLIGSDGTVYQGRPLGWMGTHAPPNTSNIGVNVIGDFHESEYPSTAQLEGLVGLVSWLCDKYDIDPTGKAVLFEQTAPAIAGHRDWNPTLCPGDRLYALLADVRNRVRANLLAGHPPYDARPSVVQYFPRVLLAGQQYELTLFLRNVGYVPWSHLNRIGIESLSPDLITIAEPLLKDGETIETLTNRPWQVHIQSPETTGSHRLAVGMTEAHGRFGDEVAWEADVLGPDAFISEWLTAGPFDPEFNSGQAADGTAASADALIAKDFFAGKPLDMMDTMDEASEKAHGYAITDEYTNGERNFRGPDGERVRDSGRYFYGEESLRLSLGDYKGGDVILRRLIDAGDRDQRAAITVEGKWQKIWKHPGRERYRLWKEVDTIIPFYLLAHKQAIEVTLKSLGTAQYGCNSFRYTLLDSGEPLVAPRLAEEVMGDKWQQWKSHDGLTDLSSAFPGKENGAVYLATYVRSPRTRLAEIRTGCAARIKAWVNGDLDLTGRAGKPNFPDTETGSVLLKNGWNRVLVKVALEPGAKELYVRLCDRDGKPIPGLKVSLDPGDDSDIKPEDIRTAKAE